MHIARLWTRAINNKKQASKGLKKTANDMPEWSMHKWSNMNHNGNEHTHTSQ
jgi:hypothetical protein